MTAAAAFAAGLLVLLPSAAPAVAEPVCDRFGRGVVAGTVESDELDEISGVVASRQHPGVLWVHDDSGGAAAVSALGPGGEDLGTYAVAGATARDWEDIAAHDGSLYIGDIGDNRASWPSVTVYRAPEPDVAPDGSGGSLVAEALELVYPDGPVDAEALLVDPRTGDLLVLTKEDGSSRVFVTAADRLTAGATVEMAAAGRFLVPRAASRAFGLPGSLVTGADVSSDGAVVLVRTYRSILAFTRPDGAPLSAAFDSTPCEVPQIEELQGESVAFTADGQRYVTIGEGTHPPVHRFDARAAAPGGGGGGEGDEAGADGGDASVGVVELVVYAGGGLVLVALAALGLRWIRRTTGSPRGATRCRPRSRGR